MDESAFDHFSRSFVSAGSRRRLLGLLIGLPLASLVGASAVAEARPGRKAHLHHAQHQHRHAQTQRRKDQRNDTQAEACIPTGQRCPSRKPRGKHHKKLGCTACCQGSFHTEADGKQYCGCQPNGGTCTTDVATSCCSGFCDGTTCKAAPCSAAIPCPQCQTCNSATGLCEAVADGTICDDGNACTTGEICQGGFCGGGTPVVCPATECEIPVACDPSTGCLPAGFKAPNTPCSSGLCCGGAVCQDVECCNDAGCASGQHCVGSNCVCDGTSCAGCCAGDTCVAIGAQSETQCGTGTPGAACGMCAANQDCVGGSCTCTSSSCSSGCCAGTTCAVGNTKTACGEGGVTCVTCSSDAAVTCRSNPLDSHGTCARGCTSDTDCGGGNCVCRSLEGSGSACVNEQPANVTCFPDAPACAAGCPSGRVCMNFVASFNPCGGAGQRACATACANT